MSNEKKDYAARRFCTQCGRDLHEKDKYCPECGAACGNQMEHAGFWLRVAAAVIDVIILGVGSIGIALAIAMILFLIYKIAGWSALDLFERKLFVDIIAWGGIAAAAVYEIALTGSGWQGTVGKKLLGIKVVDDGGERIDWQRSVIRYASKVWLPSMVGYIAIYLGYVFPSHEEGLSVASTVIDFILLPAWYLLMVFDKKKRAAHDRIALTFVLKK